MYETEIRNKEFENIEKWNNELILKRMLESQRNAFDAVKNNLKPIEKAVLLAVKKLKNYNSKIVYVGAGTSGRIGILDGVELIPTFGWPKNRVDFCFSGIDVKKASEGSEDNIKLASKLTGYEIDVYREGSEDIDDVDLDEFGDEIDSWIIDELKAIGCDTAKSVLEIGGTDLVKRTDLEEETITEILNVLKSEFEQ